MKPHAIDRLTRAAVAYADAEGSDAYQAARADLIRAAMAMAESDARRCTVPGCRRGARSSRAAMCEFHYQRHRRGHPLTLPKHARASR